MLHTNAEQLLSPNRRSMCVFCAEDQAELRRSRRPPIREDWESVCVADLFCGCGGMALGLLEAGRRLKLRVDVALAVDRDATAARTFARNFPSANVRGEPIEQLLDGPLGCPLTERERRLKKASRTVAILMGGPPCQGHSDLNNHTRRDDPRNALYARMARAAEVLSPEAVLIENVASVGRDRGRAVEITSRALVESGYRVADAIIDMTAVGVPQRRRRHLLLALKTSLPRPEKILDALRIGCADHPRTVEWAIRDLEDTDANGRFNRPSLMSPDNRRQAEILFREDLFDLDNEHRPTCHRDKENSYVSMYGRLRWDQPAQTLTTGFGSMGQGRYVHPSRPRTLTPHEAARLQTFPDYFDFGAFTGRGALAEMIGNAVPPFLTRQVGTALFSYMFPSRRQRVRRG